MSRDGKFLRFGEPYEPRTRHNHGYVTVGRQRLAHRVVATCWCDQPEGANHVHHINEDKTDNRAENLLWVSQHDHNVEHHAGSTRGHVMSEVGKETLRALRLGSTTSEATKQKQREASLRNGSRPPPRARGSKVSELALLRMRENSPNAVACEIDGVAYASFNAAGQARGEKLHSLRKRCLSPNFPSYRLGS